MVKTAMSKKGAMSHGKIIPYGRQSISQDDIDSVVGVLTSDFLTQGPQVPAFESSVAKATGSDHAVAVNSATSALHIACLALDLGPGGRLWTAPNSFVASANVARLCGADVDFVDIDPNTWNMCPQALAIKLEQAAQNGTLPNIVMPVHFGGEPCDMLRIGALARQYGFKLIEDASHAIGARCAGAPVGANVHSDITVFSFHPVKIVTTAEGGVATTQDARLAKRMAMLRSHGVTRDRALMTNTPDGPWDYDMLELGLNYRMTELQAALGCTQMQKLNHFIEARHSVADRYDAAFANLALLTPLRNPANRSALHLYPVVVGPDASQTERSRLRATVFDDLRAAGIGVNVHYIPIHTQPYYRQLGFAPGDFPQSEYYYAGAISLPMFPDLSKADQDHVISSVTESLARRDSAAA
jgi:UDP-4-amino-4,6-dideoxy-N-acetyl-beta-L-altrosamine transaminase